MQLQLSLITSFCLFLYVFSLSVQSQFVYFATLWFFKIDAACYVQQTFLSHRIQAIKFFTYVEFSQKRASLCLFKWQFKWDDVKSYDIKQNRTMKKMIGNIYIFSIVAINERFDNSYLWTVSLFFKITPSRPPPSLIAAVYWKLWLQLINLKLQ